ncbi:MULTISPECIES: hypothetical protein [unclassified Burkholderia]|uniref:hypothetical protein n=1 Tax=unclassified Burkholderia TaxID=2613784 RepID=UPI00141DC6D1|nr:MULTISPECIES: hypothetical protein [unclassified Burkholderia]NIE61981.1 hypothetical protein [Burkholderia sp. Ap-955]NIF14631.1 hypothetical protein [Burkholderia sp. Ax-1735]NIG07766.1 hypothetical protein [Burkholderia sp. Tr-849]
MDDIRIIRDLAEIEDTAYIELMGGPYAHKCWNEGSLFFREEVFGLLEAAIARQIPDYDHYAFNGIAMPDWLRIVDELDDTRRMLGDAAQRMTALERLDFVFRDSRQAFVDRLDASCAELAEVIAEIDAWTREVRIRHDQVTILGI